MRVTATVQFMPQKEAAAYLRVSTWWLRERVGEKGFPQRVQLSPKKVGYWKHELDAWLVRLTRHRRTG